MKKILTIFVKAGYALKASVSDSSTVDDGKRQIKVRHYMETLSLVS